MSWEIVISLFLSLLIVISTIILGIRQNKLEKNAQKINLFDKRYKILNLLEFIVSIVKNLNDDKMFNTISQNSSFKGFSKEQYFRDNCLNKKGTLLGDNIEELQKKYYIYNKERDLIKKKNILEEIQQLENNLIFLAFDQLKKDYLKIKESKYLFSKNISSFIIDFAEKYYSYMENCIIPTAFKPEKINSNRINLIDIVSEIEKINLSIKIEKSLNLV